MGREQCRQRTCRATDAVLLAGVVMVIATVMSSAQKAGT
jgi:hypothetical protein